MQKQIDQLEEDMWKLLEQIKYERNYLPTEKISILTDGIFKNEEETINNKNYSDTRKLVNTLGNMLITYKKLNGYIMSDEITIYFASKLLTESDIIHELMSNALKRKNNEQYRCLNSIYTTLLEMVKDIKRSKPKNNYTHSLEYGIK